MDMGLCLLSRIRTECRLWTPLCLVASSTTLPQRQRFCIAVWCSIFLYCVDYIIETFLHNFIWSELSGEKCQGNPSLAWKHQQGQTQTRYKRHNPRGSHGSRAGGGSKKSSNFISPSACATRDSQSSKSRIQTLQATMIHLWKRNHRIEIQTTTHNQHACAAYMNPDRERERGCGCASACICVLRLCMMSKSKLHLSFRPIRAPQRGSLDRYVLLHCFTMQWADVGASFLQKGHLDPFWSIWAMCLGDAKGPPARSGLMIGVAGTWAMRSLSKPQPVIFCVGARTDTYHNALRKTPGTVQ